MKLKHCLSGSSSTAASSRADQELLFCSYFNVQPCSRCLHNKANIISLCTLCGSKGVILIAPVILHCQFKMHQGKRDFNNLQNNFILIPPPLIISRSFSLCNFCSSLNGSSLLILDGRSQASQTQLSFLPALFCYQHRHKQHSGGLAP